MKIVNITNLNKLVACSWGRNPNLPAFRKPSDVYYDIQDNALIYIQKLQKNEIEDEKDIIKFVVKPTKNSWVLRTAGRIKLEDLKIQRYKK